MLYHKNICILSFVLVLEELIVELLLYLIIWMDGIGGRMGGSMHLLLLSDDWAQVQSSITRDQEQVDRSESFYTFHISFVQHLVSISET